MPINGLAETEAFLEQIAEVLDALNTIEVPRIRPEAMKTKTFLTPSEVVRRMTLSDD